MTSAVFNLDNKDVGVIDGAGYLGQATVKLLLESRPNVLCADLGGRTARFVLSLSHPRLTAAVLDVGNEKEMNTFTALNPIVQKKEPAFVKQLAQKTPMGRIGKPQEVAGAAVFLLTEDAATLQDKIHL